MAKEEEHIDQDRRDVPRHDSEDYMKVIVSLAQRAEREGQPIKTSELAQKLRITPGSVSAYLKKLAEAGLIEHEPYRGVSPTPTGRRRGHELQRAHRIWETILHELLDVPIEELHPLAEQLEHALDREQMDSLLKYAQAVAEKTGKDISWEVDPHGDPIPNDQLELAPDDSVRLIDQPLGVPAVLRRVSDSDEALVTRLLGMDGDGLGLKINETRLTVLRRDPVEQTLLVRIENATSAASETRIGERAAERVRVGPGTQAAVPS